MALISFANNTRQSWESGILDHRLKTVLRDLAFEFGGLWLTCLDRTAERNTELGGVPNSRHLMNARGKCEAADFVLMEAELDNGVVSYVGTHFGGVQILHHDVRSGLHFHIEIEPTLGDTRLL